MIREGTVATDRAALMALYNSAGGASWTFKNNWGSTEPLHLWAGVWTNNDGRVRELWLDYLVNYDCSGNNVVGTLPTALGNLDQIEKLVLCGNQLRGAIPNSLGNLTNLTSLSLWNNELNGTIPESLGNLGSLQNMYLGGNQLRGAIPESLGNLTNLTTLSLWGNQLSGAIPSSLGGLGSLLNLHLSSNALSGTIPESLGSLASLQELSLWDNELSGQLPDSLGNLTNLTFLNISRNSLDGPIPDLSRLTSLKWVYLWDNQLTGSLPDLSGATGLKELYLNRNALSGTIPNMGSLGSLTHLYLNQNQLTGAIPDSLGDLVSLQELSLANNGLDGTIPASLGGLTNLKDLSAQYNELSGPIPDLSNLTRLEALRLFENDLTGGIPSWLGGLTTLTNLSLDGNELDGPIPDLSNLVNLTVLTLRNNELTGPIPAWLEQLTELEDLYLASNRLSGEFPSELGNLANLKVTRFASNPSLTGCVPLGLRYLLTAPDWESDEYDPDRRPQNLAAQDFIPNDANGDGDTDDIGDHPGLHLPFCMVSALAFSDVTLAPAFARGTAAYTVSVANTVESTTVTVTLAADASPTDRLSIRKGTASYASGTAVPLDVGPNEITITITPTDGTPTLTYTVSIFREGIDRATLMALYNSTGGASWTSKTNWGETGEAIGTWEGVTTDANSRVTALELPGHNLSGPLPAALGSLTNLTTLDLSGNRLSGTIPDLTSLTGLTTLNLGDNQLTGTIPDWLGSLTGLQELSLRDNRLTGTIPEELGVLTQLDVLYLNANRLSGTIPAALGDLTGLQSTRFAGNTLTGCVPDGLRGLVTAQDFNDLPAHDFIAVDANDDGDTADEGDTPGLGLPFCALRSLTLNNETFMPSPDSDTFYIAARHAATAATVTVELYDSNDTVSIIKGVDTYTNGDSVPLDVGQNEITVEVTTTDGTPTPPPYTVTVTRAPNAPPTFSDGTTTTRGVEENTPAVRDIGDPVVATDADNDSLTYSLDVTSQATFDIVPTTGQLQTKAPLDHETKGSYTVTVSVRDSLDDNGNAHEVTDDTIRVTIQVAHINEAPVFLSSETGMRTVDENTEAGMNIGAPVSADDNDGDSLTYSLRGPDAESFDIVLTTGQLQTKAALDYESGPESYTVTITATDPLSAEDTIDITVTVTNVDDAGTVTRSTEQPIVGSELTATLSDPDGNPTDIEWYWEQSPNGTSSWARIRKIISATISSTYTPEDTSEGRFLRARATYTNGEAANKSAQAVFPGRVQAAPVGTNDPPEFPSAETGGRDVDENTASGVAIGESVAATDPESDTLTYSLEPRDLAFFDIVSTTGQLQTKAALDYEATSTYSVVVTATDTAGGTDDVSVTITVNNVNEPGTVTLLSLQPLVAIQFTATLDDPDDVLGGVTWSWARSPNGASDWTPISGETSDTYTPVAGDVGDYLRATAAYTDGEGPGKSAQAISANAVEVVPGRNKPALREYPTATRSFPRNTPAGRNIGAPFAATDADNDLLTYSLGGPDAHLFAIDTSNGQLLTTRPHTGNSVTTYKVFVSVSDGKDENGNPAAPPSPT